jgi:hypothetical protein
MRRASKSATEKSSSPSESRFKDFHKTTHYLTPGQDAFIKRKVEDLKRRAPRDQRDLVSESTVIQGLINFWMAAENIDKTPA